MWRALQRSSTEGWIKAAATVTAQEQVSEGVYDEGPPSRRLLFYYRDSAGELQSGEAIVDSFTSLYGVAKDDTIEVLFDPRKSSRYVCPGADSAFTRFRFYFWVVAGGMGVAFSLISAFQYVFRR